MIDLECITVTLKPGKGMGATVTKCLTQTYHKGSESFYVKGFMLDTEINDNIKLREMMLKAYTDVLDKMFSDYEAGSGVFAKTEDKDKAEA